MSSAKYDVYRNLVGGDWSIRDPRTGLVVAHTKKINMALVEFKVSKRGQQRARLQGQRNVHAYARGYLLSGELEPYKGRKVVYPKKAGLPKTEIQAIVGAILQKAHTINGELVQATYNPFRHDTFIDHYGNPLYTAEYVTLEIDNFGHASVNAFVANNEDTHGSSNLP